MKTKSDHLYYSTKAYGKGLGLPITHKIIVAHNAAIAVDSEPDKGTMFHINLDTISTSGK